MHVSLIYSYNSHLNKSLIKPQAYLIKTEPMKKETI